MISADAGKTLVAVLGTGTIGSALARNLLAAGYQVTVWNRSERKLEALGLAGAGVHRTPADAVAGATHVITALEDGPVIERVMRGPQGAVNGFRRGAVWLQTSTVGLADTEQFANLASYHSVQFVDAPVLGSKQPAERGELLILASGNETVIPRVQPLFDVIGRKTLWLGPAGAGTRMKLTLNNWITSTVAALAETISLAEAMGVNTDDFFALLSDSPVNMPYAHLKGRAMLEKAFEANFALRLAEKDIRLILDAALERDIKLPLTETAARQYQRALELGHGDDDISAVYYAIREPAAAGGHHA